MTSPLSRPVGCFLCRVMRGLAFGGLGAALFGLPAKWLGAPPGEIVYYALFGALFVTLLFARRSAARREERK